MRLLAIDPGNRESAYVDYDTERGALLQWAKLPNELMLEQLDHLAMADQLAIEMIASYGMAVGKDVFETCVWVGRFTERWLERNRVVVNTFTRPEPRLVFRREVKLELCHSAKAKDANVRQALIDRFGGSKGAAIGKKATPGPLYGLSGDGWAALGVAVTAAARTSQNS